MGLISSGSNFVKGLNFFGSAQYLNFKGPNCLSLMRFHYAYMLYHAHYAYSFSKFPQIMEGETNILGETNSAERLNYLVPSSVFQF